MHDDLIHTVSRNFFKATFTVTILAGFLYVISPFLVPIILGGILALSLSTFVDFFQRRGLSRKMSLIVFSVSLLVIALVPTVAFILRGATVLTRFFHDSNLTEIGKSITGGVYSFLHKISSLYGVDEALLRSKFEAFTGSASTTLANLFASFAYELPEMVLATLITVLAMYCFLKESDRIRRLFNRYSHLQPKRADDFVVMVKSCCREVFFSNIITGILQASIVSIGALACGIGDIYLVFFITFIVSFIPVIGAAPVAAVLAIICFMDSRTGAGIGMVAVAIVSGLSDNVVRPFLGSLGTVEVHPLIGLVSVIGGVLVFGLPGLFLGPLLSSLLFGAVPIILGEYFPENKMKIEAEREWEEDFVEPGIQKFRDNHKEVSQ
jgi:predicted PurR-regulated permease PerM